MAANAFFEHLGLVGGFLLIAWHDLSARTAIRRQENSELGLPQKR